MFRSAEAFFVFFSRLSLWSRYNSIRNILLVNLFCGYAYLGTTGPTEQPEPEGSFCLLAQHQGGESFL